MNNTRNYFIALLCAAVFVALLYQVATGWDTVGFLLRGLLGAAIVALAWRSGIIVSGSCTGRGAGRRIALHALCWAVAAAALFAGFGLVG